MKNFFILFALAGVLSVSNQIQASVLYSDPLTAPPLNAGNLVGQDGWTAHSGTANQIQVGALGATLVQGSGSREDANVAFTPISAGQTYYFGFDVVVTGGNSNAYFAHFKDAGTGTDFTVRTFVAPSTNGGDFSFGLSPDGSSPTNTWASGLTFGQTYRVVGAYSADTRLNRLWVDPTSEGSTSLSAIDPAAAVVAAFALRQAGGNSTQLVSNLSVGTTWDSVMPNVGTNSPVVTSFDPVSGVAGTSVTIGGSNFTGATNVAFSGVAATFSNLTDTSIRASVPVGALTGPISVSTPNGVGSSTNNFFVPTVAVVLPASINEGTNATGRVTLNVTPDSDVDVTLTSSSVNDLTVDSPVTVFGGTSFSDFAITAPADGVVDSNVVVTVTPSASGFVSAPASITVINTNLASVSLPAGGYTQDFSTFSNAPTLPLGWSLAASVQTYTEWGTNNASGAKYSSPTVNVFGYKHTGLTGTVNQVLNLKNTTGSTITDLTVSYYGRAYINTGDARYPFYTVSVAGSTVTALAYSTADGDNVNRSASLSGLNIANNEEFQVVWSSDGSSTGSPGSNSRAQIGVSTVSVAIGAASFPPTVGSLAVPVGTIYQTTAQASADVSSDGGAAITSRGFVYAQTSVNADPTIGGTGVSNVVDASSATGPMSASLTGLSSSTQYSIKAYAANVEGTTYTSVQSFTTLAPNPSFSGVYTQSFNGFTNMAAMPAGWRCFSSSNLNNYAGDWNSQSATTGGFYGRTNIPGILGYLHTSGSGILSNGLTLINDTGATLTNLFVSYMGEVNLTNNGRSPIYAVSVDGQTVEALAYSTEGGTNAFQSAQITGLSITNGGEVIISWASDRGASAGNGSSKMIGMTSVRVATSPIPEAPVITSPSSAQGTNGVAFSYQITANNNPTSFGASNLPAGLSVNTNSGLISGTPTVTTSVTVALSASNEGGTGTSTLSLNIVAASDSTFTSWAEGAPLNSANLELYAIGGATSPTATNGVPSQAALTSSNLSIIAIVRTNDPDLTVFGQATTNLKNVPWTTNGVTKTNAPDQLSVPSGTARQIFSIERGTNTSLFLRIDSILQP